MPIIAFCDYLILPFYFPLIPTVKTDVIVVFPLKCLSLNT